jgi:sugar phosphate isomerase/epimerase
MRSVRHAGDAISVYPTPVAFDIGKSNSFLDALCAFCDDTAMRIPIITSLLLTFLIAAAPEVHVDHPGLVKLHWQQAANAQAFREMTTFQMIDLLHEMDFHHIQLSPGQALSADHPDAKISPDMAEADVDALMAKLKAVKMDIVSFGVTDFGSTPDDAKKVFEFGKKLKLKTIVSDASPESLVMLDKLATDYQINVAITSDSTAKRYVTCDAALEAIKGRSARTGICADLKAWKTSGQNPLDCIKKVGSHVLLVNLSDVSDDSLAAGDCLKSMRDLGFKGICCVNDATENPDARLQGFAKSVNAFNQQVTILAKD